MKKFFESFSEHAKSVIDFEMKKVLPLIRKESESNEDGKVCYICWIRFFTKLLIDKNYQKFRDHFHYTGKYGGAVHSIWYLKLHVPNETPVVFHRVSNYDYHFIIKELANESEGQFERIEVS